MSGLNDDDPSYRYTAPGLVAARALADANAHGSPTARRRARIMAWCLIASAVLFVTVMAVTIALSG